MNVSVLSRPTGWFFLPGALAASVFSLAAPTPSVDPSVETAASPLAEYVVSATRTLQERRIATSAVSLLPLSDLVSAQVGELRRALDQQPGVNVITTGAVGGQASVFIRGASSHQTLFVVDGVRMSDRAASYTNYLGGAPLAGFERVEVLRGPQSTLYGSSAMGGVVLMETARGEGPATGAVAAMGGSFETWSAGVAVRGGAGPLGYSATVGRYETANDAPDNEFAQWSAAGRLDFAVSETVAVGATVRWFESDLDDVGSRSWPAAAQIRSENLLATVSAEMELGEAWTSRLTVARHERDYRYADSWGASVMGNVRRIAEWQNTWRASDVVEVVAGASHERSRYDIAGGRTRDELSAGYVSATWRVQPALTLTGGLRYDDFDTFGDATTGRAGASWLARPNVKLRASYGTGFTAPGSDDRFGVPTWGQLANPDLAPEKAEGWDLGVDLASAGGGVTAALTYFQNRFRNLFEWEMVDFTTFEGRIVNRARAKTEGVELAVGARLAAAVRTRLAYTYLEARNQSDDVRLVRRPRHAVDAELVVEPGRAWTVGAGLRVVADRMENGVRSEDFTTVRLFTSYAVRDDLWLKLRVENALDEKYEEVLDYPSLPRGVFGTVEWRF